MSDENKAPASLSGAALDHLAIMVPEIDPSLSWYQDNLGARVIDRFKPAEHMDLVKLSIADFTLDLVMMPDFNERPGRTYGHHHFAMTVPDCDALTRDLAARGVEVYSPPADFELRNLRWSYVKDNLGNIIEIISDLRPVKSEA